MAKSIPSTSSTAFTCPHCGAFTTQHWHAIYSLSEGKALPETAKLWDERAEGMPDLLREKLRAVADTLRKGLPFFASMPSNTYPDHVVSNLHISECYNCSDLAVWVGGKIVFPVYKIEINPNADLPDEIRDDFIEAGKIADDSPRGAAALLRLCVQKLCKVLGESGADINRDIGNLVKKGLNPVIQQSLDSVRVIGNESVHPGELDLKDDRETVMVLFHLINSIADQMITHPKTVAAIYAKLPPSKIAGISSRDKGASSISPSSPSA